MTEKQPLRSEILQLIGEIVLSTQDAERYMKFLLPHVNSQDPSLGAALSRFEKLKKRTFGELVGKLVESSTLNSSDFERHVAILVNQRNQIVHHFDETYGQKMESGALKDVAAALAAHLSNLNAFRDGLAQMTLYLLEAMRDTVYQGTLEYQDMAKFCAALRQRLARTVRGSGIDC